MSSQTELAFQEAMQKFRLGWPAMYEALKYRQLSPIERLTTKLGSADAEKIVKALDELDLQLRKQPIRRENKAREGQEHPAQGYADMVRQRRPVHVSAEKSRAAQEIIDRASPMDRPAAEHLAEYIRRGPSNG